MAFFSSKKVFVGNFSGANKNTVQTQSHPKTENNLKIKSKTAKNKQQEISKLISTFATMVSAAIVCVVGVDAILPTGESAQFHEVYTSERDISYYATLKGFQEDSDYYVVQRALNRELKLIFDENNISIPFPQVTINQPEEFAEKVSSFDQKKASDFAKEQSDAAKGYEDTNK